MESRVRRGGLVGPLLLIGLGILFLLSNLGMLSWSIWTVLFRLWPVILIAIGLDILIGRHSMVGSLVVLLLVVLIIGGVFWFYPAEVVSGPGGGFGPPRPVEGEEIIQPLDGATRADVQIGFGAGTLRVGAMQEPSALLEGTVSTEGGEMIIREFNVQGDTAHFRLRSETPPFSPNVGDDRSWDLRLNPQVPMRLRVNTGVGTSELDLARLLVHDLDLDTGVGRATVVLPATGQVAARVNGGVGEVEVSIPSGMAARIRANAGIGNVEVRGDYQRNDQEYVSPGYDTAPNRLELRINGGIGRVVVNGG